MRPLLGLLLVILALPLHATTFAMMRDEHLVEDAQAIVLGRVRAIDAGAVATRYELDIERAIKGEVEPRITIRVPGGSALRIDGAPAFESGERVLLFLVANQDGSYSPLHLLLGTFRDDGGIARRDAPIADARELEGFVGWVAKRAPHPAFGHPLPAARGEGHLRGETYDIHICNSLPVRWFTFQQGGSVAWHVAEHVDLARRALDAWNDEPSSLIDYRIADANVGDGGFTRFDGRNSIVFDDPNDEIPGSYQCPRGGAIAMAGVWIDESVRAQYAGSEMIPIRGADVVFNDGLGCWSTMFARPELQLEEALGHELGHTLGFLHSCGFYYRCNDPGDDEAIMRAAAHLDDRGARLSTYDILTARSLYTREGPLLGWSTAAPAVRGEPVQFVLSAAPAGVAYEWDFGDGTTSAEARPRHTFAREGTYPVRLRATDATGTSEIVGALFVTRKKQRAIRR